MPQLNYKGGCNIKLYKSLSYLAHPLPCSDILVVRATLADDILFAMDGASCRASKYDGASENTTEHHKYDGASQNTLENPKYTGAF